MKKITLLLLIVLISIGALAYDFEVDGKYYYIKSAADKTVVLTYNNYASGEYSGDFVIPETVTYNDITFHVIGCDWDTFRQCDITAIHIPKGFTSFDYNYNWNYGSVFFNQNQAIKVYVPDLDTWMNITYTHSNVFWTPYELYVNYVLLENVVIPEGTTAIAYEKFGNCNSIKSVKLANTVKEIGAQAFYQCHNLERVECNNGLEVISVNAFAKDEKLEYINIPQTVKLLGDGGNGACFMGCSSLSSNIIIPEGITNIPSATFAGCSKLTEVTIPSTANIIYWNAFDGCSSLKHIYSNNPTPPLCNEADKDASTIFNGVDKFNCTIHVPKSSAESYKNANGWKQFFNIIEGSGETTTPSKCSTPTIALTDGHLSFGCDTEGAQFVYTITCTDAVTATVLESVDLNGTYIISVYAMAEGFENSDVATATLIWESNRLEGECVSNVRAMFNNNSPFLITQKDGTLTVSGVDIGDNITAYSIGGVAIATSKANSNCVKLNLQKMQGEITILKVGERKVKVLIK